MKNIFLLIISLTIIKAENIDIKIEPNNKEYSFNTNIEIIGLWNMKYHNQHYNYDIEFKKNGDIFINDKYTNDIWKDLKNGEIHIIKNAKRNGKMLEKNERLVSSMQDEKIKIIKKIQGRCFLIENHKNSKFKFCKKKGKLYKNLNDVIKIN